MWTPPVVLENVREAATTATVDFLPPSDLTSDEALWFYFLGDERLDNGERAMLLAIASCIDDTGTATDSPEMQLAIQRWGSVIDEIMARLRSGESYKAIQESMARR